MNAEPAASAGEHAQTQTTQGSEHGADHAPAQPSPQQPHSEPIGSNSLLNDVLNEMEVPAGMRPKVEEPSHEHKENTSRQSGVSAEGDRNAERRGDRPAGQQSEEGSEQQDGEPEGRAKGKARSQNAQQPQDDEPLTAEQRQQWPPEALARIHKKAAQTAREREARELAEYQRDEALLRAERAEQVTVAPTQANPLAHINDPAQLEQLIAQNQELLDWAELHPNGVEGVVLARDANGDPAKMRDYTAEEIAEIKVNAQRKLRVAPQQRTYLIEREQQDAIAHEVYPELFQQDTTEYKVARQFAKLVPGLQQFPDATLWIGRAIRGLQLELGAQQAAAAQNGKPAPSAAVAPFLTPQPRIAPSTPAPQRGGAPSASRSNDRINQAKVRALADGGTLDSAEDMVGAILEDGERARSRHAPALA